MSGFRFSSILTVLVLSVFVLSGCLMGTMEMRDQVASRIARPAFMVQRVVPAGAFNLTAWEKMHAHHAPATVYIEGDGIAWVSPRTKSLDPTPKNPVALHLAAMDKADNVAWLARPCQYSGWNGEGACPDSYWTGGRTSPEVLSAYHEALDNIKAMYDITGFHLVGYSGGAAVAALIAAQRTDVLSLRTVAGNLDYATFSAIHQVSPLKESVDPIAVAAQISGLPQRHFIGGQDEIVPPAIFNSWKQASGTSSCVRSILIEQNDHESGWVEKWPELLAIPVVCDDAPKAKHGEPPTEFYNAGKTKMPMKFHGK